MHGLFHAAMTANHNMQITSSAQRDASKAVVSVKQLQSQLKVMQADLAKTLLICESLWELLADKTDLSLDELYKKLYEVDMRDGVLDGQNQRKAMKCPNCSQMVSPRHAACLYCGHVMDDSVFQMG